MKKIFAVIAAVAVMAVMAGCGSNGSASTADTGGIVVPAAPAQPTQATLCYTIPGDPAGTKQCIGTLSYASPAEAYNAFAAAFLSGETIAQFEEAGGIPVGTDRNSAALLLALSDPSVAEVSLAYPSTDANGTVTINTLFMRSTAQVMAANTPAPAGN